MYVTCHCCYTQEQFFFFLPGAIWLTTCLVCGIQRVHFNICQFSTSHGLFVHHVSNSFISIFSERFSVCDILSLYASVSPSSDAELSNSCLQLLQLYKLVGLFQLVPANLMASTWDLFTAISMLMNFESLKSRYHCLHIHNFSCALLRDLIIMFSLFCIYYYIFAFRSLYHTSISLFDDNNHDGKNDVEDD